jgi:neurofibromin 1
MSSLSASWKQQSDGDVSPREDLPHLWADPIPLDDALARHLLLVILSYARLARSPQSGTQATTVSIPRHDRSFTPGSYTLGKRFIRRHSHTALRFTPRGSPTSVAAKCATIQSSAVQMAKLCARIIFYLSASNWSIVFLRLKARLSYLITSIEETLDTLELGLIEWANLDKSRLAQVFQEASKVFTHSKRPAQVDLAKTLHQAIWNWIDCRPFEFEFLFEANGRLEGSPDILFDILHSMSDVGSSSTTNIQRVMAFYPLMAMLLVLSPEIMRTVISGDTTAKSSSGLNKKHVYLDNIRKGLSSNKLYEVCSACGVDFVRAASSLRPGLGNTSLRAFATDIQEDLIVRSRAYRGALNAYPT